MPWAIMKIRNALLKIAGPARLVAGDGLGDLQHHEHAELADHDVAAASSREPAQLAQAELAEVEPPLPAEADPAQRRQQPGGLHDDAERGADAEDQRSAPVVMCSGVDAVGRAVSRMNTPAVAITTRLFRIGVHIGAAKWPRVLSSAPNSAAMP